MLYRPAVAAVLQDRRGRILVCERRDFPGAWQFPQGGIELGETRRQALAREVEEELSLPSKDYEIVGVTGPFRYRLPGGRTKHGFRGQSHHYFLLRLRAPKSKIDIDSAKPEFRRARWVLPDEFKLEWLPLMKRRAYRAVFQRFFGVRLTSALEFRPPDDGLARHEAC